MSLRRDLSFFSFLSFFLLGNAVRVDAAPSLFVYAVDIQDYVYVNRSPYITWSAAKVQAAGWQVADQFLIIQTNAKKNDPAWAVRVFTDNTRAADAAGSFNLPDWWVGNEFFSGGSGTAASPVYKGYQTIRENGVDRFPKAGLISADGEQRIPMIWSVYRAFINENHTVPRPIEQPAGSACDFRTTNPNVGCNWFYFLDKGDLRLNAGTTVVNDFPERSDARFLYTVPMRNQGVQENVGTFYDAIYKNGETTPLLYVAVNFINGTKQLFSTTIFLEMLVL